MNRLKNISIIILLSSFVFSFIISCDSTDPKPPEKPPGYQEDIPWPSLADSPWPMFRSDPQNTGRSQSISSENFNIDWVIDTLDLHSGISVGEDSSIYVSSQPYLYAYNYSNGLVKWRKQIGYYTRVTPIATSENTIIVHYAGPEIKIAKLGTNGEVIWSFENLEQDIGQLNIDPAGNIYFMSGTILYAITKDGQLIWKKDDNRFYTNSGISFSPDGSTLYLTGNGQNNSIIAFDKTNRIIKWSFGSGLQYDPPLIDAFGNIYFTSKVDSMNNRNPAMYCLKEDGTVKWFFSHSLWFGNSPQHSAPTMDKNGNLYFGSEIIYSLDHLGKLRWQLSLGNVSLGTPFICDVNGITLITIESNFGFGIISLHSDGSIKWNTSDNYFIGESSRFSPVIIDNTVLVPTQDKYLYKIL